MSKRPVDLFLDDICEGIDRIEEYTKGMSYDTFSRDRKSVDAVARNLEIIGEAANRLPEDFKEKHVEIEWQKIVGLRHRIVTNISGLTLKSSGRLYRRIYPHFGKLYLAFEANKFIPKQLRKSLSA